MTWYVSRRMIRLDARHVLRVEGTDKWNAYALDGGDIGDFARWWLKTQQKYQRFPFWRVDPPPITTVRILDWPAPGPLSHLAGGFLTLVVVFRRYGWLGFAVVMVKLLGEVRR